MPSTYVSARIHVDSEGGGHLASSTLRQAGAASLVARSATSAANTRAMSGDYENYKGTSVEQRESSDVVTLSSSSSAQRLENSTVSSEQEAATTEKGQLDVQNGLLSSSRLMLQKVKTTRNSCRRGEGHGKNVGLFASNIM